MKNERGVTLIEALAATAILSIVVIMFITISNYSSLANKKSTHSVDAYQVAEEQLNLARAFVKTNNALPPNTTERDYSIILQVSDFANNLSNYDTSKFGTKHVSLQSVVLMNLLPKILTVTVSWSD